MKRSDRKGLRQGRVDGIEGKGQMIKDASRNSDIQNLVQRIVEEIDPLRIIIFGSAARGESGTDSDVDILIVMPEGVHRRRTAQRLYRNIRNAKIPFDLLVATTADIELKPNCY